MLYDQSACRQGAPLTLAAGILQDRRTIMTNLISTSDNYYIVSVEMRILDGKGRLIEQGQPCTDCRGRTSEVILRGYVCLPAR